MFGNWIEQITTDYQLETVARNNYDKKLIKKIKSSKKFDCSKICKYGNQNGFCDIKYQKTFEYQMLNVLDIDWMICKLLVKMNQVVGSVVFDSRHQFYLWLRKIRKYVYVCRDPIVVFLLLLSNQWLPTWSTNVQIVCAVIIIF